MLMPSKPETIEEATIEDIEHKFPFQKQIKGDNISINTLSMRLSVKRPSEFEDPHKLSKG